MKILFLQNIDALGGVSYVNSNLANEFIKNGEDVYIYSVRTENNNVIKYNPNINLKLINSNDKWGLIKGVEIKKELKKFKFIKAANLLIKRFEYKKKLLNDYNELANEINKIKPNYIICSHYEVLDAIPEEYLKRTIMHHHNCFEEGYNNKANRNTFIKYNNKIGKILYLTEDDCKKSIKSGLDNSSFIYNAVRFKTKDKVDAKNTKNVIYIGRIAEEQKRISLLVKIFNDTIKKYKIKDWNLLIYGNGEVDNLKELIKNSKHIKYMGVSKDVAKDYLNGSININTSAYEGFSMSLLEGYECNLPAISFKFSDSIDEQLNDEVGRLIPMDDLDSYSKELSELMKKDKLRVELSNNTKQFIKKFYTENIIKDWYKLFKEISKNS